jgi:hypothetical protein
MNAPVDKYKEKRVNDDLPSDVKQIERDVKKIGKNHKSKEPLIKNDKINRTKLNAQSLKHEAKSKSSAKKEINVAVDTYKEKPENDDLQSDAEENQSDDNIENINDIANKSVNDDLSKEAEEIESDDSKIGKGHKSNNNSLIKNDKINRTKLKVQSLQRVEKSQSSAKKKFNVTVDTNKEKPENDDIPKDAEENQSDDKIGNSNKSNDSFVENDRITRAKLKVQSLKRVAKSKSKAGKFLKAKGYSNIKPGEFLELNSIVNPHNYLAIITPKFEQCSSQADNNTRILILAFVTIAVNHFEKRNVIRSTWANVTLLDDEYDLKVFFSVGKSKKKSINRLITKEAATHKDILQESYIDSYNNLTSKVIGSLKWASVNCSNTHFLMKVDDDAIVNTKLVVSTLKEKIRAASGLNSTSDLVFKKVIIGDVSESCGPIRNPKSKYYVAEKYYNDTMFPVFAFGSAYLLSSDVAFQFYNLSLYVYMPPFSDCLEDIYFGFLSAHLGNEYAKLEYQRNNFPDVELMNATSFLVVDDFKYFKPVWDKLNNPNLTDDNDNATSRLTQKKRKEGSEQPGIDCQAIEL